MRETRFYSLEVCETSPQLTVSENTDVSTIFSEDKVNLLTI